MNGTGHCTDGTDRSGLPLRDAGVPCDNCGCENRRPGTNRCAACGRFASDPRYAYSRMTDTWYRVSRWEEVGDGHIRAIEKEEVAREHVPQHWLDGVQERSVDTGTDHDGDLRTDGGRTRWHRQSVDGVRQEAGIGDQSNECPNGSDDCPDANGLPCTQCFLTGGAGRDVATDGGRDVTRIETFGDLAADATLAGKDVDKVAELLLDHGHKPDWLIAWVPKWIMEEKGIAPAPASYQIVHGRVEHETEKAYCVAIGRDDVWLPKSVISVYEPAPDADIKIPRRGLAEFEGGEPA